MKIVIDIPKETFEYLIKMSNEGQEPLIFYERAILRGTPLQKGKWVSKKCRDGCYLPCCSACGESSGTLYEYNYCPNCGAEMEVEE